MSDTALPGIRRRRVVAAFVSLWGTLTVFNAIRVGSSGVAQRQGAAMPNRFSIFWARVGGESLLRLGGGGITLAGNGSLGACIPAFSRWDSVEPSCEQAVLNEWPGYRSDEAHFWNFNESLLSLSPECLDDCPDNALLYWFSSYLQPGDLLIAEDVGETECQLGRVQGGYEFSSAGQLHTRAVDWSEERLDRDLLADGCFMPACTRTALDVSQRLLFPDARHEVERIIEAALPEPQTIPRFPRPMKRLSTLGRWLATAPGPARRAV
jgi:hypothetical protein